MICRKQHFSLQAEPSNGQAALQLYLPDGSLYPINSPRTNFVRRNGPPANSGTRRHEDAGRLPRLDRELITTEFEVLPDGSLIDLVKDPANPVGPSLLRWRDDKATLRP